MNRVWSISCLSHIVDFVYSKSLQIPKDIKIPIDRTGCKCRGDCSSSKNCDCAKRNGSDLPYVSTQRKSSKCNGSKHNSIGRSDFLLKIFVVFCWLETCWLKTVTFSVCGWSFSHELQCRCVWMGQGFGGFLDLREKVFFLMQCPGAVLPPAQCPGLSYPQQAEHF